MPFDFKQLMTAQIGWGGVISALGDMLLSTAGAASIAGTILPLTCGFSQVMDLGANIYTRGSVRIRFKTGPQGVIHLARGTTTVVGSAIAASGEGPNQAAQYPNGLPQPSATAVTQDTRGPNITTVPGGIFLELSQTNTWTNRVGVIMVPILAGIQPAAPATAPNAVLNFGPQDFSTEPDVFRFVRVVKGADRDMAAGMCFDVEVTAVP